MTPLDMGLGQSPPDMGLGPPWTWDQNPLPPDMGLGPPL